VSVEVYARVVHHSKAGPADQFYLLVLANYADHQGRCWPSVGTLAKHANRTPRAVQQALARLAGSGELQIHRQAGGTEDLRPDQRPNLYRVCVECPPSCDGTTSHRTVALPRSSADLWTKGAKQRAPRERSFTGEVQSTTPGGDAVDCTQTVTREPTSITAPSSVTGPRARCTTCGKTRGDCERAVATSGHAFTTADG
jgi:hypothetical protein